MKSSKCHFNKTKVEFLGYIICQEGRTTNPDKVKVIQDLEAPTTVKGVRSFLGMTGYYRCVIPVYTHIAVPLVELTKKHVRYHWGPDQQHAFESLKQSLATSSILAHPCLDRPYRLYTDTSDHAVGGILVQTDDLGIERVIQYVSGPQTRWATCEREAYAVIYRIQKLRPYLYGAPFTVRTDHKPLRCLFTKQMNYTKIQRRAILLEEYNAKIEYRKGRHHVRADMLSD